MAGWRRGPEGPIYVSNSYSVDSDGNIISKEIANTIGNPPRGSEINAQQYSSNIQQGITRLRAK